MMTVLNCIAVEHDIRLVLIAALICVTGAWIIISLFHRASHAAGLQRAGWHFLAAVAAGASIWCTHFIAMLAYDPGVPISFDPVLTIGSLLVAMAGTGSGFILANSGLTRLTPALGGGVLGLSIAAMHYTGMLAYRVEGIVSWDISYLAASIILSVLFSACALHIARRSTGRAGKCLAAATLVLAIVSLHFTAMTAFRVAPLRLDGVHSDPAALQALALAVASIALVILGAGLSSYLLDESLRAESFARLHQMAMTDSLTGLPNRASFNDRLDQEIELARALGCRLAVIGIDLDRFKEINDLRGHAAGDQVLQILARRMSGMQREGEFIARLGGDEFAALHRMRDQADLADFLTRLENALLRPIRLDDGEVPSGASIGVAIFPEDADNKALLIGNADLAMYRAKADLARTTCFYEPSMDETVRARRSLANDLREAVENNRLDIHYQVQTSVSTGEIRGYEALLRWRHPELGVIPPSEFIPLAEETGLILQVGEWALRTACAKAASWDPPYKVAVNLSPVQLAHADLAKLVLQVLLETRLSPDRLELELTESAIFADKERSLQMLRQIKALGVSIALDDFGTGYSSLDTLRAFPFSKIKLDRSFMQEIESSPQAKAIIRAVLALGKSLEIPILAEGIETEGQLSLLGREGCDEAQGYLLGRPAALGDIVTSGQISLVDPRSRSPGRPERHPAPCDPAEAPPSGLGIASR